MIAGECTVYSSFAGTILIIVLVRINIPVVLMHIVIRINTSLHCMVSLGM